MKVLDSLASALSLFSGAEFTGRKKTQNGFDQRLMCKATSIHFTRLTRRSHPSAASHISGNSDGNDCIRVGFFIKMCGTSRGRF